MIGVFTVGFCGVVLLGLLIIFLKIFRAEYNEIDKKYGKPYQAKLVKMIGGYPGLKRGSMVISLHPKDAIAFNRKVFLLSQISSIKIISKLPEIYKNNRKATGSSGAEDQYLCLEVNDEAGKHEVVFAAKSNFKEIANPLLQKWTKYNLRI
jgi:hypothetical protein